MFFSGEKMTPEGILAAYPKATFIARGCVRADPEVVAEPFRETIDGTVWGIAVAVAREIEGPALIVSLDDGRQIDAVVGEPFLGGDPATVIANARYWESPPEFVDRIASIVPIAEDV